MFTESMRFRYDWRSYQKRVLDELEGYLNDKRVHVVAAPGSGKTVLGLEIVRRLGRPTLVLAPTLAIRDQWVERLVELFLPEKSETPPWVSREIDHPAEFTVSTYQALHMAVSDTPEVDIEFEEEGPEFIDDSAPESSDGESVQRLARLLRDIGVGTIVLDEAHHLRTSWWRTLTAVLAEIPDVKIIALTATPPYDVPEFEWERYLDLCGPVDVEVSVPELVKAGDLCPHQDLVMLSTPTYEEADVINRFRAEIDRFLDETRQNKEFLRYLLDHPWIVDPDRHEEEILDQPALYSSMLVFLNSVGVEIPRRAATLVADDARSIPPLDMEWMEILLSGLLFPSESKLRRRLPVVLQEMAQRLRRIGAVERGRVQLRATRRVERLLRHSVSKVSSVVRIVRAEHAALGDDLRMVILADYVRREMMPKRPDDKTELNKMGVVPLFEAIRRDKPTDLRLGILTGSIVVIPASSKEMFLEIARASELDASRITLRPLAHDERFVRVDVPDADHSALVHVITELFGMGGLNVVVGTTALLGEGWDAPTINSLVIASVVGSFMLSNQMRGRAIRTQPGNPHKTANIWHLACVEKDRWDPGPDFDSLTRRFEAFVGVSFEEPVIENGIGRLAIGSPPFSQEHVERVSESMLHRAKDRDSIRSRWNESLVLESETAQLMEEVHVPKMSLPRGFVFRNTISAVFWQGVFLGLYFFLRYLQGLLQQGVGQDFVVLLQIGAFIAVVVALPYLLKALRLFVKHGPIKSSLLQIGQALLQSLYNCGEIRTNPDLLVVVADDLPRPKGMVYCHLLGGTHRERWTYIRALQELLGPITDQRYILVRKSKMWDVIRRTDYHPVPKALGVKRNYAEYFARMWKKYVGAMDLVYTRTRAGRAVLLRARTHSMAAAFHEKPKRVMRWR
ncbi:MAG: DEAD/DEAH box helicase family protein [Candidatus Thorarchaeota archaeon]